MASGDEREALIRVADRLCAEFGYEVDSTVPAEEPSQPTLTSTWLFGKSPDPDVEQLIAAARYSLTRLCSALEPRRPASLPEITVPALIDGAELVMRGEMAKGKAPSAVMPDFVFLVALPLVDQDEALELSQRTASLLEEELA